MKKMWMTALMVLVLLAPKMGSAQAEMHEAPLEAGTPFTITSPSAALMEASREIGVSIAFENQRKLANLALMFEYYEDALFCWDVGHEACFAGGREYMPLFGDKLAALHIHDNTCEFNHDFHMLPYDGKINFDKVARAIAESGYTGSLMLEVGRWGSPRYDGLSAEEYYNRAGIAAKRLRDAVESYRK